MKLLSLNCQKAYNNSLIPFLHAALEKGTYDFLVLQEVTVDMRPQLAHPSYEMLTAYNEDVGATSHLCVIYRNTFTLEDSRLVSLESCNLVPSLSKRPGYGLLYGTFRRHDVSVIVGSLHLHAGFSALARRNGLRRIQEALQAFGDGTLVVVGGDCNFGPFEKTRGIQSASPYLTCVTSHAGPTLNSRYTEYHPNIINRTAVTLGKLGLGISLAADHFFVNAKGAAASQTVAVLKDRVSDHSPVEFYLSI